MQVRKTLKISAALCGIAIAALLALALWLTSSSSGLRASAALAARLSHGRLEITGASGQLRGPLSIEQLHWHDNSTDVLVRNIELAWSPAAMWQGELQIQKLEVDAVIVTPASDTPPATPPKQLMLPFALSAADVAVHALSYGALSLHDIRTELSSDGRLHRIKHVQGLLADVQLAGQGELDGAAPPQLKANLTAHGKVQERPLGLTLNASGTLEKISLALQASEGLQGKAQAVLTPFAPHPLASASVALDQLDPASWQADAPHAKLSVRATLDKQVAQLTVRNLLPGRLDEERLPLSTLSAKLKLKDHALAIDDLQAQIQGGAIISGHAAWQDAALNYQLAVQQLNAAQWLKSLRPTRLDGTASGVLGSQEQSAKVALQSKELRIAADVAATAAAITLPRLEMQAANASLNAQGEIKRDANKTFSATGELRNIDLSRFSQSPVTQINGQFKASGQLSPAPVLNADFTVADSRIASRSLAGRGKVQVAWPRIPQADIELHAGPNQLRIQGAFGRPGDKLQVVIDAPKIDVLGVSGDVNAQLMLSGTPERAAFSMQAHSARLTTPQGSVRELALQAEMGTDAAAPLQLALVAKEAATVNQAGLLNDLKLDAHGTNRQHRIDISARLLQRLLQVAANGSADLHSKAPLWRGQLVQAELQSPAHQALLHLAAPAELRLGTQEWVFGPAQFVGDSQPWSATLAAQADATQLKASLQGKGGKLGVVDAQLSATLLDAWTLNTQSRWQGDAQLDVADLAVLMPLLGDGMQSGGQLKGALSLRGTPAHPHASGQLQGQVLSLYMPEQGLRLSNGELNAVLDDNLLRVNTLRFDSPLKPLPRTLRVQGGEALVERMRAPGKLEISGETRLSAQAVEASGTLNIRFDRLGVYQQPDQWTAVSGTGSLAWQNATLALHGNLAVDAGYWQLASMGAPALSDDVVFKPGSVEEQQGAGGLRLRRDLDISVDAGPYLYFNGAGLSSRLAGNLRLKASGRDLPRTTGTIKTEDGRFDAYGQSLQIDHGELTFQGLLDNPALNVKAVRKGLSVEAGVLLTGTAQKPIVTLTSDPNVPDAEKLAWLVLGRAPDQTGGDAALLMAAAGGLFGSNGSGKIVQQLKDQFGVDSFEIRQGTFGSNADRQMSSRVANTGNGNYAASSDQILSVGKRISKNATLSYENSLGKAESLVKLTVSLTKQVALIGRAGSDNALDLFYTFKSKR